MFITFFPLHGQERGLSVAQIGFAFFVQGGVNATSRIPLGRWTDQVSDRRGLVVLGLAGFAAALVGLGMSRSPSGFYLWSAAMGASMALAFTSVGALTAAAAPPDLRGLAMGGYNTCIFAGMMLCAALMGSIAQTHGFAVGFVVAAAVNVTVAGGFLLLTRRLSPRVKVAEESG
jgi:MFS family permease